MRNRFSTQGRKGAKTQGKPFFLSSICIVMALVFLSRPVFAAATLAEYQKRLSDAELIIAGAIVRIHETPEAEIWEPSQHLKEEDAKQFRNLLPQTETVEYRGQILSTENARFYELLKRQSEADDSLQSLLTLDLLDHEMKALQARLNEVEAAGVAGTRNERDKIAEILKRSEFTVKQRESLRERLMQWLTEKILWLLSKIAPGFDVKGTPYGNVLRIVLVALFILAFAFIARITYLRFRRSRSAGEKPEKKTILGEEFDEKTTAETILQTALDFARKGEYRQAVRKVYIALLYEMDKREVIRIEPGLTNREYLNAVRAQLKLYPPLRDMTNRFDEFWYGQMTTGEDDYRHFLKNYQEAVSALPSVK